MDGERMGAGASDAGTARLTTDLDGLRRQLARLGQDATQAARHAVQGRVDAVRTGIEGLARRARHRGRTALRSLEGLARRHPLGALAAAFGVGVLAARLAVPPRR